MKNSIYLDYAAATPMADEAAEAMKPYFSSKFYNPSAIYQSAREVRKDVEKARGMVADVIGSKDQEITFTAGGTEANNLAIHGVMSQFPDGNIVVSSIEHESVLEPAKQYEVRIAPVDQNGIIDLHELEKLIDEKTVLVSVMYANNEIGTIQPIKEISKLIEAKRLDRSNYQLPTTNYPIYFHTDACQASNYLDLSVSRLGADLMTLNGGKIYAMKQSGCLYAKSAVKLNSLIQGGGQEDGVRSGTENVPSLIAFATMLQLVNAKRKEESHRLEEIRNKMFATLSQNIPSIKLNGHKNKRLPNNLNITIPGVDGERLLMEIDEAGIMLATGSACTASSDEPSHVLLACGLSARDASASLRITLGQPTTEEEVMMATEIITKTILKHQRLV